MGIVLQGAREFEAGGVKFNVRAERMGDFLIGRKQAIAEGLEIEEKSLAPFGFALAKRIEGWEGVSLQDGQPAPCTAGNVSELFEKRPDILVDLIRKVYFEAPASGNSDGSQPGNQDPAQECAETADQKQSDSDGS